MFEIYTHMALYPELPADWLVASASTSPSMLQKEKKTEEKLTLQK